MQIDSDNGMVPSSNKPLAELMLIDQNVLFSSLGSNELSFQFLVLLLWHWMSDGSLFVCVNIDKLQVIAVWFLMYCGRFSMSVRSQTPFYWSLPLQNVLVKCADTGEPHCDGLVQDCSNSSASTMELLQSCTMPSIITLITHWPLPGRCGCNLKSITHIKDGL